MAETGYETRDVKAKALLGAAGATVLAAIAIHFLLSAGFNALKTRLGANGPAQASVAPPPPRLQKDPREDFVSYLSEQKRLLNSYGWVDRGSGTARIPIARAMEILSHAK